jgi:hypothetical protein
MTSWQRLRRRNPTLLLALVEDLIGSKQKALHIEWDRDAFFRKTLHCEPPRNEDAYSEKAVQWLLHLDVDDVAFTRVRDLELDGDKAVYNLIGGFGESGRRFKTRTLDGIELLCNLRDLDFGGLAEGASFKPLAKLPKLAKLTFSAADGFRDYEALSDIPSLKELQILNLFRDDRGFWAKAKAIAALGARGVRVHGPGVAVVAEHLSHKKRFHEALAIYDHLVDDEYVEPDTLFRALYAASPSVSGKPSGRKPRSMQPMNRKRMRHYLRVALPHGARDALIFYNAADVAYHLGDVKQALEHLQAARKHGYEKPAEMRDDPVFAPLRNDPRFQAIFADLG